MLTFVNTVFATIVYRKNLNLNKIFHIPENMSMYSLYIFAELTTTFIIND